MASFQNEDPALPVRAVLYGLAARLAAESQPDAVRGALTTSMAPPTLDSIVELAGNHAIRDALADLGPAPSMPPAPEPQAVTKVLEHGTPRDLGRLVERQILNGPSVLGVDEAA